MVALAAAGAIVFLCLRLRRALASRAELQKRYEALREREQQLQHVADAIPALISYVGSDWRYRFVNRLYGAWFRSPPEEAIGKTPDEVLGKEMMEVGRQYMERALRGEEVHFEVEAPYPGGARWVNVDYVPDFDASGKVAGFGVLVLDITQRKLAENAVRQSEARLKEANQALQASSLLGHQARDGSPWAPGQSIEPRRQTEMATHAPWKDHRFKSIEQDCDQKQGPGKETEDRNGCHRCLQPSRQERQPDPAAQAALPESRLTASVLEHSTASSPS